MCILRTYAYMSIFQLAYIYIYMLWMAFVRYNEVTSGKPFSTNLVTHFCKEVQVQMAHKTAHDLCTIVIW